MPLSAHTPPALKKPEINNELKDTHTMKKHRYKRARLIQFGPCAWVDPATVTAIRCLPTEQGPIGTLHRARVIIHHGSGYAECLHANDDQHAEQMAEEFARRVNT